MDTTASYYDVYWSGAAGWRPADKLDDELRRWLEPLAVAGTRLVDVGCGDGARYGRWLVERGVRVSGTDISPNAVEAARAVGIDAMVATGEGRIPFSDGKFDSATCFEVF